jgi:subtilase family serine protease
MLRKWGSHLLAMSAVLLAGTVAAKAEGPTLPTRHTRDVVINKQVPLVGHLSANKQLDITLILQQRNQDALQQFLKDVQDPNNPSFHHYLTVEQFTEKYGPTVNDYETVKTWAKQNGFQIRGTSRNRMNLQVRGTVQNIESALHIFLGLYQHPTEERTFFSPDREPTPDLSVRLWAIGGLDNFSTPHRMLVKNPNGSQVKSNATTGSGPDASFLGSDIRAAYYSAVGGTLTGTGQGVGLFEFLGTDLTDLDTYYTNVGQTNNVPITLTSVDTQSTSCIDDSKGDFCDDTEQTIDMTQSLGMAPGLAGLTMWIGTGGLSGQTLDDPGILNGMATANPLQNALSCSWAWKPTDNTTDDPYFLEFQAQGQTFFNASGDDGNWAHAEFVWPADDPNLQSVGGTDLDTASAGGPWASETGWSDGGGGISPNKFAIPSWQVAAAAGCAKCSQTYRNGPDVSANANFSYYVCADQTSCTANDYGGTSFATPAWAGLIALADEQAADNGSGPVGFINPTLYNTIYANSTDYADDFHNVTSGGNSLGCTVGYSVSCGLGSPQGPALITALVGAPTSGYSLSASPNTVSIAQGASSTSTITTSVTGGFDGSIALTASGQPSGVTVSFSPTSITGAGTSTATISVGSTVTAGTYTITVTGTSGSTTETTTISLTVTAVGNFTIKAAPTNVSVAPGGHGQVKVTTAATGSFDSSIALTASGAPSGVVIEISPATIAAPGNGSAAIRINVSSSAKAGTSTITITGTGGGNTNTTTFTLKIS